MATHKTRKVNHGATNLSARSDGPPSVRSERGSLIRKDFYRSWTHKLISPESHEIEAAPIEQDIVSKNTATWRPVPLYQRKFASTTMDSYLDPSTLATDDGPYQKSEAELSRERMEKQKQVEAVEALCKTAKAHFGTTAMMMKVFNKKSDDTLSMHELNMYLKRNKIDHHLSIEERQRIFDYVHTGHEGKVNVREFLQKTEEQEFKDADHAENMFKIRNFLKDHLEKLRIEKEEKLHSDPDLEKRKKNKGIDNEKALIRQAIGQKTFDIEVDHDELHDAIENLHFHNKTTEAEHNKYIRFLRHSNLNLSIIPFYDMRHENLENLKARAVRIDRSYENPEIIDKYLSLSETRWQSSLATTNDMDEKTLLKKKERIHESRMALSRSLPNLSVRPSPLSVLTKSVDLENQQNDLNTILNSNNKNNLVPLSPELTKSARSLSSLHTTNNANNSNTAASSPINNNNLNNNSTYSTFSSSKYDDYNQNNEKINKKSRNLLPNSSGIDIDDISTSNTTTTNHKEDEKTPMRYTTALKLKKDLFYEQSQDSDFYTQIVDDSTSMGKMKDPSKVMRIDKIDPHAYLPTGKRAVHKTPTDWSRIGVGGNNNNTSNSGYNNTGNYEPDSSQQQINDQFLTTNSKFYPPLIYESSKPVTRNLISESELNFRKKEFQRNERYSRMQANIEVTKTRLEYEEVEKEVRSLRRDHGRLKDKIRYQTAMLLNDLKGYKSQPLVRMAKKQNIYLADRMWNGTNTMNNNTSSSSTGGSGGVQRDKNDFISTYNASYDSSILKLSDTLIHPPTGNTTISADD